MSKNGSNLRQTKSATDILNQRLNKVFKQAEENLKIQKGKIDSIVTEVLENKDLSRLNSKDVKYEFDACYYYSSVTLKIGNSPLNKIIAECYSSFSMFESKIIAIKNKAQRNINEYIAEMTIDSRKIEYNLLMEFGSIYLSVFSRVIETLNTLRRDIESLFD